MEKKETKIEINVEKKPGCIVEAEIIADESFLKEAEKLAIKDIKKEVSMPGFRKGKAPVEMIKKKYPQALHERTDKKLADLVFIEAHKEKKLPLINPGSRIIFNIIDKTKTTATLKYTYETEPEVPKIDPKLFKLEETTKKEVTKKEIDEAIRQMRFFYAKFESVDRPIKEYDYIIIDLDSIDEEPHQRVFSDTRFEVSKNGMANWMQELVKGSKVGDTLEGISKPDEDAPAEEKEKFLPKKVKVTIKKIEEAQLPELNDEFAKRIGSETIEEMETSIKNMLEKQAEEGFLREKRHQVENFLLKNFKFDLPRSLVTTEIESRKNSYMHDPRFKAKFEKMKENDKKAFEKDLEKQAENALRIFYLTRTIIEENKIQIKDEEITNEAIDIIYRQSGGTKIPDPQNIPRDVYAIALSKLTLTKAQDYILEHSSKN
ncbi:MAG: trigger factor [Parachlamydiales bacterium]|nr:trigger factor [Parachlamydiales bacterium]